MRFILVFVLLLASAITAYGQEDQASCPSIDLRTQFDFGPVRDQEPTAWCAGFASTDLLSFQVKKQLSPFDASLSALREETGNFTSPKDMLTKQGSLSLRLVLDGIATRGVCSNETFNANDPGAAPALIKVETVVNDLVSKFRSNKISAVEVQNQLALEKDNFRLIFPKSSDDQILQAVLHSSNDFPLLDVVDSVCNKRTLLNVKVGSESYSYFLSDDEQFPDLPKVIASGRPVAVIYSSYILKNIDINSDKVGHLSSLVGMRFNPETQQCELLLRNSWGHMKPKAYDPRLAYEDGYLWMPYKVLRKNMSLAQWLY